MSTSAGNSSTPRRPDIDHHERRDTTDVFDGVNRHDVVNAEKEQYGGVKIGAAFFGWLTATAPPSS